MDYHVTSVRNGSVYGHSTEHCDESGCNGSEQHLGAAVDLGEPERGSVVEVEVGEIDRRLVEWRGYYSLDNGSTWHDASDEMITDHEIKRVWESLVEAMDPEVREATHAEVAPCSEREFLAAYLKSAGRGLVIG